MGMTIDKAITEVQQQKLDYQEFWEEYKNEHIEALDMAIDIMRKYQQLRDKISTIYVGYRHGYEVMADVMEILSEVEDENDD